MVSRNEFEELRNEVESHSGYYPNNFPQRAVGGGGYDTGYDGAFAIDPIDDDTVTINAGVAIFGSGKLNISAESAFVCDVSSDGTVYIYAKLYATDATTVTYEYLSSKTFPSIALETIGGNEIWTYPIIIATVDVVSGVITDYEQQQYGYHHVAGVVS